jgi:hypothetical protein
MLMKTTVFFPVAGGDVRITLDSLRVSYHGNVVLNRCH